MQECFHTLYGKPLTCVLFTEMPEVVDVVEVKGTGLSFSDTQMSNSSFGGRTFKAR